MRPAGHWQGFYRFTFGDVKELNRCRRLAAPHGGTSMCAARRSANMRMMMRCLASLSRVESEHHVGRMEHTMVRVLFRIS